MTERKATPAKGTTGFLLYDPSIQNYIFRVYDPEDKRKFTDYGMGVDDLKITIVDETAHLYEYEDGRHGINFHPDVLERLSQKRKK